MFPHQEYDDEWEAKRDDLIGTSGEPKANACHWLNW